MDDNSDKYVDAYLEGLEALVGGRIHTVRRMTENEIHAFDWPKRFEGVPVVLIVENDGDEFAVVVCRDPQDSGPGFLDVVPLRDFVKA